MTVVLPVARILLAALAFTAMGWQLALHVGAAHNTLNFFSYFTNLSNICAACVLLLSVCFRSLRLVRTIAILRYVCAVNMAIVGIVYVVLLRHADLGALRPWVNVVLHYIMPIAIVLDWLLQPPRAILKARHLVLALVLPSAYLVYTLLRGAAIGWYPYPFLNPEHVGGYSGVALYAAGIFVTFLAMACALRAAGNYLAKTASRQTVAAVG